MTEREQEKALLDTLAAQRHSEILKTVVRLLDLRFERYKNHLVTNEDNAVRGKAQECRELLRHMRGDANGVS